VAECKIAAALRNPTSPSEILEQGYQAVVQKRKVMAGSATACILSIDKASGQLHSANLGDSGYLVIRNNDIVHKSDDMQHNL
jgi:serine/threonine protein phosphatase PrpC